MKNDNETNGEFTNYSKNQLEKAGKAIVKYSDKTEEYKKSIRIVDGFRKAHAYSLEEINQIIEQEFKDEHDYMIVHRLKRLESIERKLKVLSSSNFANMQDLGGIRIIVPDMSSIYETISRVKDSIIKSGHRIKRESPYIDSPRRSGYRSHHIVVEFCTNDAYDGHLIEIQIRTRTMHLWATAVEIMDVATSDTIKSGTGDKEVEKFFMYVSAIFSISEETQIVEGIEKDEEQIIRNIFKIDRKENILERLLSYSNAIKRTYEEPNRDADYYLIITDMKRSRFRIASFDKNEIDEAANKYFSIEKKHGTDAVLVSARKFDMIREAFPNYFIDIIQFKTLFDRLTGYAAGTEVSVNLKGKSIEITTDYETEELNEHRFIKEKMKTSGLGETDGDTIVIDDEMLSLDDTYLRFSSILVRNENIGEADDYGYIDRPAIISLYDGSAFYVERGAKYVSNTKAVIIYSKKDDKEELKFLLGWMKSTLYTWNMVFNIKKRFVTGYDMFSNILVPSYNITYLRDEVVDIVDSILSSEETFINRMNNRFGSTPSDNDADVCEKKVNKFNNKLVAVIQKLDYLFNDIFDIDENEYSILMNDLAHRGYYVGGNNNGFNGNRVFKYKYRFKKYCIKKNKKNT